MGDESESAVAVESCGIQEPGCEPKLPYVSGVGGLTTFNNYWSSSQNDANNAWNQNVGNGGGPD